MTATSVAAPQSAEPPRDRYGRYLLPIPGTGERVAHTRVTTLAGSLKDGFSIAQWQQRMVAKGIGERRDLYALAASTPVDDKRTLQRVAKDAIEAAKGSSGANLGTALHAFTEAYDRGEQPSPPEPWDADLTAYVSTLEAAGIQRHPWWVERVLYHPELLVAGTADRLVKVPGQAAPMIADVKTGGFLAYDEIALQLALYARAPYWYDPGTDTHGPVDDRLNAPIDTERALVIHLPEGRATCDLWVVDIAAGWEAVQLAFAVRDWRKRKDLARRWEA